MKASIRDEGNIVLFRALDDEAVEWLEWLDGEEATWFHGALVIEHRYADDFIQGFIDDGGEVS